LISASSTDRVLPVPGSDVIRHLGFLRIWSVVADWCSKGLNIASLVDDLVY
jgi:hypothetical protein